MKMLINGNNLMPPAKKGDAGYDLICAEDRLIQPFIPTYIPADCAVKLPKGHWGLILPRSSTGRKGLLAIPGVIDEGYTGPLYSYVMAIKDSVIVKKGERVAQLVIMPLITPTLTQTDKPLPRTDRGNSGFGSTDKIDGRKNRKRTKAH